MGIEELKKELEKLKDLKIYVFEWEVYVKVEDYRKKTIENRKLNERIKELEQCNLNLQTWLDNKEKVNKSLREELNKDNREVQVDVDKELLKANDYLIKENKELKSELEIWKLTAKDYAKLCWVDLDDK